MLTSVKCFEHFFESRPNELAAFKLEGKILEESNLKRIGIFMSNVIVITLQKIRETGEGSFSCVESNTNEQNPLSEFICIRLGTSVLS